MTDETQAVAVLSEAGMVAGDDDAQYYELDKLLSGRPPSAKFENLGDYVTGQIVEAFAMQRRNFDTQALEFWDDGSPKLQAVTVLQTEDGLVTVYYGSRNLEHGLKDALREAGVRGPRRGGWLHIRYVANGEPYRTGAIPPKEYEVTYDPPGGQPRAVTERADDLRGKREVQGALGPVLISAECAGDDCRNCEDRKCGHKCHRASRGPEPVAEGNPEEVPF